MSITAIGSGPSQMLASLLSRLTAATATTSSPSNSTASTASGGSTAMAVSPDNSLTGSAAAQLSAGVLQVLMMMQSDPGNSAPGSAAGGSTPSDQLSNLVSAIDTDGSGTISQAELECYIEGQGGTQAQADALYSGLTQNGTNDLTRAQMQSDLQNAQSVAPAHHGHHHHGGGSAGQVGSQLFQAMDSNGDGSVDQSEFENFVTALGGTTTQADADYSALQGQSGSGITATGLSNAISAYMQSSAASPVLDLLDGVAGVASNTRGAVSV